MLAARLPGLAAALAAALLALGAHAAVPPLTPALVAVTLGLALAATRGTAERLGPGLRVASRQLLRAGVALLGLQLVAADLLALGWPVLVVVVAVVGGGIAGTWLIARRLGVDPDAALLVACGFSICGAAAIAAVDGVRRAREETVATAVSLVVVFGTGAMLVLPLLSAGLGLGDDQAGAWAGAAVQEVGQVVVAGGLVGGGALQVAVVVKLARVLCLGPVLAVVSWRQRAGASRVAPVPMFVVGFVGLVAVRSLVDVPAGVLAAADVSQQLLLAAGMFALGTSLSPGRLRSTGRPLVLLAGAATGLVAVVGLPAAYLV